jgi:hypothetical protein
VAEQEAILELGDQMIGGAEIAARLQAEDAPVQAGILGVERPRQDLVGAGRPGLGGPPGQICGIGSRRRRRCGGQGAGAKARHQQPAQERRLAAFPKHRGTILVLLLKL